MRGVFDSVAGNYDLMNDLMSGGAHRLWKEFTLSLTSLRPGQRALDVAGGTGDLTTGLAKQVGKTGVVILSDINAAMLGEGRDRLLDAGVVGNVSCVLANAEKLPFADSMFDCVTIGFGLRNVTDKAAALADMRRVLKPGGQLLILEFSQPVVPLLKPLYDLYSFRVLPLIGKLVAKDEDSYRYLAESIRMHPDQETLLGMLRDAGLEDCRYSQPLGWHRRRASRLSLLAAHADPGDRESAEPQSAAQSACARAVRGARRASACASRRGVSAGCCIVESLNTSIRLTKDDPPTGSRRMRTSPARLLNLAALAGSHPEEVIQRGDVTIRGDAEVAQKFRELAMLLKPDVEEELSKLIGDTPAHQALRLVRMATGFGRRAARPACATWPSTWRTSAATWCRAPKPRISTAASNACAKTWIASKPAQRIWIEPTAKTRSPR